jgi:NADP-dependent 3-hydroxy acid dehydrogenase YdfG
MSKTIAIVGFGPGTSSAVAQKFGSEGFNVAILGRDDDRLAEGVSALKAQGIKAFAFAADAAEPASIRAAIVNVRSQVGSLAVLHWSAYGGLEAGDLLTASADSVHRVFDVAVFGLLAAVEEALPDLKSNAGAVLIANGGFAEVSPAVDEAVVKLNAMGLALASATKNKLAGLLAERLKPEGIYVGEVIVYATIKGTGSGGGDSIEPAVIAEKHWEIYQSRADTRVGLRPAARAS